jgi:hypothetical protein
MTADGITQPKLYFEKGMNILSCDTNSSEAKNWIKSGILKRRTVIVTPL